MVLRLVKVKTFRRVIKALIATVPLAAMSVDAAYKQRGYFAVGGEWIITIMIFAFIYFIIKHRNHWRIYGKRPKEN